MKHLNKLFEEINFLCCSRGSFEFETKRSECFFFLTALNELRVRTILQSIRTAFNSFVFLFWLTFMHKSY